MQAALPSAKFTDSLRLPRSSNHRKPVLPERTVDLRDDDSSSSTTISVGGPVKELPLASCAQTCVRTSNTTDALSGGCTKERSVRFAEQSNREHTNHQYSHEEVGELWYTGDDCARFKKAASNDVHKLWEMECNHKSNPKSYLNVLEEVFKRCRSMDSEAREVPHRIHEHLWALFQSKTSMERVGLEKYASDLIREDRDRRRQRMFLLVDSLQDKYSSHEYDDFAESLRNVCLEISRPSRLFATELGKAQSQEQREGCG